MKVRDIIKLIVIIEKTATGYSAYSPDLDGCVATGETEQKVKRNMREAVELHLEGLRLEGYEIPEPHSLSAFVEVAV